MYTGTPTLQENLLNWLGQHRLLVTCSTLVCLGAQIAYQPVGSLSSYYSPGICPGGYTIACLSFSSVETATEIIATCCPSNYVCLSQSNLADGVQSTEQCYTYFTAAYIFSGIISAGGSTTLSGRSVFPGQGINAYSVQVRWQSTDIEIIGLLTPTQSFPSSASSTVSPASSLSSATTASNTSSITVLPTPSQPSSLNIGAKIAIGVTIPIIFFALLLGFFLFWQKRRSKSRTALIATISDPFTCELWWKLELDAGGTAKKSHSQPAAAELDTATQGACRDLSGRANDDERW